jgi:hypothetical protein
MIRFNAFNLAMAIQILERSRHEYRTLAEDGQGGLPVDPEELDALVREIKMAHYCCECIGFQDAAQKIASSLTYFSRHTPDASSIATELRNIIEVIQKETNDVALLRVQYALRNHVDNPKLFGTAVYDAFPSARSDIKEAGNCLAADCNTAAVFHLMRAVEWGLRALCVHLGLSKTKRTQKGKASYTPLSFSEWEAMLNQLNARVDAKLAKTKRGSTKQELQEFYYPMLQDIRAIRDAWRVHVMHTRRDYSGPEAAAILDRVKRLMTALAEKVSER